MFAINESVLFLRIDLAPGGRWLEGLFLIAAAVAALVALGQRLPLQNVLMAATLIYCISGLILLVAAVTGVPFGPIVFSDTLGGMWFGVLPWTVPLLWVVAIVSGRGVARLIMRPWRKTNFYGFWVIGITCLLLVHLDLALEAFAVDVRHYWLWRPTVTSLKWHTAPWVNFLGWFVTALAVLSLTLPSLINKQPVKRPMDYQPLIMWMLLHGWLATGNAVAGLWPAVAAGVAGVVVAAVFAVRGARW